jgi:hypothetical protein
MFDLFSLCSCLLSLFKEPVTGSPTGGSYPS